MSRSGVGAIVGELVLVDGDAESGALANPELALRDRQWFGQEVVVMSRKFDSSAGRRAV